MVQTGPVATFEDVPLPGLPQDPPPQNLTRLEAVRVTSECIDALERAAEGLTAARDRVREEIRRARAAGVSWQIIGDVFGMDRETARRRFGDA